MATPADSDRTEANQELSRAALDAIIEGVTERLLQKKESEQPGKL